MHKFIIHWLIFVFLHAAYRYQDTTYPIVRIRWAINK